MNELRKREGFEGQVLHVIPRPMLENMAKNVLLHQLVATDIGWFPEAKHHYRARPQGAPEHILILCVGGKGWCQVEGWHDEIGPNQAVLIPRGKAHSYGANSKFPWSIHFVHFSGTVSDFFPHLLPDGEYKLSVAEENVGVVETLFQECYRTFLGSFAWQRMSYVTQTLHLILGKIFFDNPLFSPLLRTSNFHSMAGTLDYLSNQLDANLTLEEMAAHANLSVSHFSRRFKEQTGFSPVDYYIHLKIQHASMLLTFTDKSVKEIGAEVGYQDAYYFSRIFRKVMGMSPSQFRGQTGEG